MTDIELRVDDAAAIQPRSGPRRMDAPKPLVPAMSRRKLSLALTELDRENCQDADGNRYCVIVWRLRPGTSLTTYTLDGGAPVNFVDDCQFELVPSGTIISRCDDPPSE